MLKSGIRYRKVVVTEKMLVTMLIYFTSLSSSPRLLQVCELVKFMIEHCQQILGEDPSTLFGGPPQRFNAEETGSGTETVKT